MNLIERIIEAPPINSKKSTAPVIIEWKGEKMVRNHSIRATVREIIKLSSGLDVVKINLIGMSGNGKTTLSQTIAHLIHKIANIPYAVKVFDKDHLLNFEETLRNLTPTNYVLIFDDVSYLEAEANKNKIDKVKQAFTTIRHLEGGQDVKIIAIFNFHYGKALNKFLRICHFSFYVSADPEEQDNMQQILGVKNASKIKEFQRIWRQGRMKDKFSFRLGKKNWFSYPWQKPFMPFLFSNGSSVRYVVSPKREWVDPICSICSNSDHSIQDSVKLEDFLEDFSRKFTIGNAKTAVKIKLFQNGINAYPKRVKQAMQYIDQYLQKTLFSLEDLALAYDLDTKPTRLFPDKQPELKIS